MKSSHSLEEALFTGEKCLICDPFILAQVLHTCSFKPSLSRIWFGSSSISPILHSTNTPPPHHLFSSSLTALKLRGNLTFKLTLQTCVHSERHQTHGSSPSCSHPHKRRVLIQLAGSVASKVSWVSDLLSMFLQNCSKLTWMSFASTTGEEMAVSVSQIFIESNRRHKIPTT